jgi:hypothetical protein
MASSTFYRVLVTAAAGLALVVACSGAAKQDVLQGATDQSSGGTSGTSGTSGASGTSGTSGTSGASGTSGTSGTSGNDAGACPTEVEPNDHQAQANLLAPTRCGTIGTPNDTDFLTFTLKESTTKMQVKFDGRVTLTITVDGSTVILGAGGNQNVPFVQGKPYVVQVNALEQKATPAWRVDLIESP